MTTITLPLTARRIEVRPYPLALAAVLLLGTAARLAGLTGHLISYDETFTLLTTRLPLARVIAATAGDVHPPGSYIVSWLFARVLGPGVLALRLPSALAGVAALPLVLMLARRLRLSEAATLAGLALFALSPFQVHYSQDGRMYALLQVAVLVAALAALDRRWWLMGLALTAALWLHNYGLFYLAVIGAVALVCELGRPIPFDEDGEPAAPEPAPRGLVVALAVPVILWLPWLAVLRAQMANLASGYWIAPLSLGQAIYPLYVLVWGVSMPGHLNGPAALVVYALLGFALYKVLRLRAWSLWPLVALAAGPFVLAGVASLVGTPIYLFRGFIGAAGPLALLIGWAITERAGWPLRAWAAVMVLPLLLIALHNRRPSLMAQTGENATAAVAVMAGWQEGDVIIHGNVGSYTGFLETMRGYPNYLLPVQPGSVGVLTPATIRAMGFCVGELEPGRIVADCGAEGERVQNWRRAWLVWGASQTISGVEDAAIAAILARYPDTQVLDIQDIYHGPQPVEGGVWLLTLP